MTLQNIYKIVVKSNYKDLPSEFKVVGTSIDSSINTLKWYGNPLITDDIATEDRDALENKWNDHLSHIVSINLILEDVIV